MALLTLFQIAFVSSERLSSYIFTVGFDERNKLTSSSNRPTRGSASSFTKLCLAQ